MILILLLSTFGSLRLSSGFNFSTLDKPTGIFLAKEYETYISYDDWRLVYFYDLQDYYDDIETFEECLRNMKIICSKLINREPCEALLDKHRKLISDINRDVEYLQSMHENRHKRDAIFGSVSSGILKPIFGIMSEEDAKEIYTKINEVIDQQHTHKIVIEDNLSLVARTIRTTNNSLESFRTNLEKFGKYIENMTESIDDSEQEIRQHINFKYISSLTTMIAFEHERVTRKIKETLKNTLKGEFTELITFEQFKNDIEEITRNLDENSFLIATNLQDMQEVISIKGTVLNEKMMIEITLPILNKKKYQLNHIIALPMRVKNTAKIINLENQYFLVDDDSKTFIPLLDAELQKCKHILIHTLLCFPQTEIYLENEEICESNIIFERDTNILLKTCRHRIIANTNYVKQLTDDTYYINVKDTLEIKENCIKQPTKLYTLNTTGILKMKPNCEIMLNSMKILTKNIRTREKIHTITKPYTYRVISIDNMTMLESETELEELPKLKYLGNSNELTSLYEKVNKDTELLKKVNNIKHVEINVSYWSLWVPVLIIATIFALKFSIQTLIKVFYK